MELLERIKKAILPCIEENACYLDEIVYEQEKNEWYLRIFIDKNEGSLDMETCVIVSEEINIILDEHDFIKNEYYLEVSSPGAERELKTFDAVVSSIGEYVYVKLKDPKSGIDELFGTLKDASQHKLVIEYRIKNRLKEFIVDYENIRLIRLAIEF